MSGRGKGRKRSLHNSQQNPSNKRMRTTRSTRRNVTAINSTRLNTEIDNTSPDESGSSDEHVGDGIKTSNDNSENSSGMDQQHPGQNSKNCKPKMQIFKGLDDKVNIENWLKRFEMISMFYNWSDNEKLIMLGDYLEDDALNWYIENYTSDNYEQMKNKLISRFGLETVDPIIEFVNLKYDNKLGVAAKLTESQMIPLMINGLNAKMIDCFTAAKPNTFAEFYSIAKTAENNMKSNTMSPFNQPSSSKFKPFNSDKTKRNHLAHAEFVRMWV